MQLLWCFLHAYVICSMCLISLLSWNSRGALVTANGDPNKIMTKCCISISFESVILCQKPLLLDIGLSVPCYLSHFLLLAVSQHWLQLLMFFWPSRFRKRHIFCRILWAQTKNVIGFQVVSWIKLEAMYTMVYWITTSLGGKTPLQLLQPHWTDSLLHAPFVLFVGFN